MAERALGRRLPAIGTIVVAAAVYGLLGAVSISTAYVQTNAAAVWMPSGFAVGLLTVLGLGVWPAVALGAFVVNLVINITSMTGLDPTAATAVAACVAAGNTGEALLGAWLVRRYASGAEYLWRPRGVAIFAGLAVTSAPIVSMAAGVSASYAAGVPMHGSLGEVMLTWYIADAVGILIFCSLTVLLMTDGRLRPTPRACGEVALLSCGIVIAGQAMSGVYFGQWLVGWPKIYMVTPFLLWAAFRFRVRGALFSIVLVLLVSVVGTMRGFQALPAETPSRSLLYLQIFLGLLTVMTLSMAAALSETDRLRASLEDTVRVRTRGLEDLLREREIFTSLVAHDLQSPLYGVRNAIKAISDAIAGDRVTTPEVVASMTIIEQTCSTIADRVAALLTIERERSASEQPARSVRDIVAGIATAHELALRSRGVVLETRGDTSVAVQGPRQVEHVLDILVDNAIKHSPRGATVTVTAVVTDRDVALSVTDAGAGIEPDSVEHLFRPRSLGSPRTDDTGAGLGLYLAHEQASRLGGRLAFRPARTGGAEFHVTLPREGLELSSATPAR